MKTQKMFILLMTFLVLIIGITSVSAGDINNTVTDNVVQEDSVSTYSSNMDTVSLSDDVKTVKSDVKSVKKSENNYNTINNDKISDLKADNKQNTNITKDSTKKSVKTSQDATTNNLKTTIEKSLKTADNNTLTITNKNIRTYFTGVNDDLELALKDDYVDQFKNYTFIITPSAANLITAHDFTINTNNTFIGQGNIIFYNMTLHMDPKNSDGTGCGATIANFSFINIDRGLAGINGNSTLENMTLTCYTEGGVGDLITFNVAEGNYAILRNSYINSSVPSNTINWALQQEDSPRHKTICGNGPGKLLMDNNVINITEINNDGTYSTLYGMYFLYDIQLVMVHNNISIYGEKYLYALDFSSGIGYGGINHVVISENNILIRGLRYTAGIYFTGQGHYNNTVSNNNITLISGNSSSDVAEDSAYGIVLEDREYMGMYYGGYGEYGVTSVQNHSFVNNTITVSGNNVYAIECFGGSYTTIANNTFYGEGINPKAIALTGVLCTIENNSINMVAQTNASHGSADYFKAISTGILLQWAHNVTVNNNNISYVNGTGMDVTNYRNITIKENRINNTDQYSIVLNNCNNTLVENNLLSAGTLMGNEAVGSDNENYTVINNTRIPKTNTTLIMELSDKQVNIEKNITVFIQLLDQYGTPMVGSNITLTLGNDTQILVTDENGSIKYTFFTTETKSNIPLIAEFKETEYYTGSISSTEFDITKVKTNLTVNEPFVVISGNYVAINGSLVDGYGNLMNNIKLNISINGVDKTVTTNKNGKYALLYKENTLGSYDVVVTYEGNFTHQNATATTSFTVKLLDSQLTLDNIADVYNNNAVTITGVLTDESTSKALSNEKITITINDKEYTTITDAAGKYTYTYTTNIAGLNTVTVSFNGNQNYEKSTNTTTFNVNKYNTKTTIITDNTVSVNDTIDIKVNLTDENNSPLSGQASLKIGDNEEIVNVVNGIATFKYTPSHAGVYNIVATFNGNDSYTASNDTATITVNKLDTNIVIDNSNYVMIGHNAQIKVTLADEKGNKLANKIINLTVNGDNHIITTDNNGVATYEYTASTTGVKTIVAKYAGESDYNSNQTTSTITVTSKKVTNLDVQTVDTKINKTATITVTLTDEDNVKLADKEVTVDVDGTTLTNKTNSNGVVTFNYVPKQAGDISVVAKFNGDDTYEANENSSAITVNKLSSLITLTVVNDTAKNTLVNVTLADEYGNSIVNGTVIIKDKNNVTLASSITDTNGISQVTLDLASGNNDLNIIYDGNAVYSANTTNVNVNVKKSDVKIALPDYDMYIFDYSSIIVNVTDEYGNPVNGGYLIFKVNGVTLKSNGKFYSQETNPMKFSVVNGKATIVFNATSFYNKKYVHSMIVKYSGTTSQYNSVSSDTKTLSINKRIGYMTVTTDKSSYNLYETVNINATYYDITHGNATPIYSDQSCYAIYKINGVTSKVNGSNEKFAINNSQVLIGNNSKSQINYIHIDHTAPNKKEYHTIEVKTHNEYYTTLVGNATITLNKSPTHIDINSVTYNKTSNKITISANIKDYKNNNTKGVNYYSVKINGVTYKVQGKTTFNTTGGNIEITINSTTKNIKNIELVTREKLAYDGSRNTTTNIQTVK